MPSPAPAEEAIELYNRLCQLPPTAVEAIGQIYWQLRRLNKKLPGDPMIALAYVQSLVLLGHASEAIEVINCVWWQRNSLDYQLRYSLVYHLLELAQYARAAELASSLFDEHAAPLDEPIAAVLLYIAWGRGDVEAFRAAIARSSEAIRKTWEPMLARLSLEGLLPHLSRHQQVVNSVVEGHQVGSSIVISNDESHGQAISQYIYVGGDKEQRLALEDEIHSRLDALYSELGMPDTPYWELITPIVLPATARPFVLPRLADAA